MSEPAWWPDGADARQMCPRGACARCDALYVRLCACLFEYGTAQQVVADAPRTPGQESLTAYAEGGAD